MQNATNNCLLHGSLLRGLLGLAGPMFVSALLQNGQSLIDLFWIGKLGSDAVAALALSGTLLMALFPLVMGMATGTVALVSRLVGAGNHGEAASVAAQSLVAAVVFGWAAGAVGWVFAPVLCRLLGGSAAVVDLGAKYLRISFLGSFMVFLLFIGTSVLQAAGNAVVPMRAMILASLLNLVLDPIFIFGWWGLPRGGVQGAALATVLSEAVAAGWVLAVLSRGGTVIRLHRHHWRWRGDLLWRVLKVGLPSSGQMLSRSLMNLVLMRIVAACGTMAVAAYGVAVRFHMLTLMPAFILGNATATMVGQNLGNGRPDRAERTAWLAAGLDVLIMLAAGVILTAGAPQFIRLFDPTPSVVAIGASYLRIVSFFYVFAAISIVLGRALQGAGDTVAPMVTTVVGLWGVQVPLALLLSRWLKPPTDGIWWAIAVALTVNGLMVAGWFQTGRWKTRKV